MRAIDEQVRVRVIEENKEYLAMLDKLEDKASRAEKHWRTVIDNHRPVFTVDQFKLILMCLHPDGQRTPEKLSEAFRSFNDRKTQLTNKRF